MGVVVHREVTALQLAGAGIDPGPAEHRGDARDELFEAEGLHQVVVAAQREAAHLVFGGVASGEEEHRRAIAGLAEPLAHVEPVEVGQHHVEHDQVGFDLRDRVDRIAAVGHGVHLEAGVAQGGLEHRAEVVLVIDEQEAGGGDGPSMASEPVRFL